LGAQARIAAQNAVGGVNGHKLVLVEEDNQSTPAGDLLASKLLVQKGAFGIVDVSGATYGSYKSMQGIPIVGPGYDGPQWNSPPNTNLFNLLPFVLFEDFGGTFYTYTTYARFLKNVGATKVAFVIPQNPAGPIELAELEQTAKNVGLSDCYSTDSVPLGSVDFTSQVLAIKSAGCDAVIGYGDEAQDVGLATSLRNAGLGNLKQLYAALHDPNVIAQPGALAALQNAYAYDFVDYTHPTSGAQKLLAELRQYTTFRGTLPPVSIQASWSGVELMIEGLQLAGKNPTRQAFIADVRHHLSDFTADGFSLPQNAANYTAFGSIAAYPKQNCEYFFRFVPSGYDSYNNGTPVCGSLTTVKA
jgi:ABC-type branched-subunit amino acid transport system substrate-binding protein